MEEKQVGQWAILPALVRYDPAIPANAKLIYAEIAAKINEEGYCFCHNKYFAERFRLKEDSVSSLIKRLETAGYIRLDIDATRENRERRRIYLTGKPYDFTGGIGFKSDTRPGQKSDTRPGQKSDTRPGQKSDTRPGQKSDTRPGQKSDTRPGQKSDTVSDLNPGPIENNNIKINPPISPKGGRVPEPDWKPDMFARFWEAYPPVNGRRPGKDRARKAWNKLRPDRDLMMTMSEALRAAKESEMWQRGIGIPYASTWINQRQWEDEIVEPAAMPAGSGYWAADLEVM